MMKYEPKGPTRFDHQKRGLKMLLKNNGVGALLYSPGLGKTTTVYDYLSILTLSREEETRAVVFAPLAALDTWVMHARQWATEQVDVWVETVGGSILERGQILAARGGNPYRPGTRQGVKKDSRDLHVATNHRSWKWAKSTALYVRGGHTENHIDVIDGLGQYRPRLLVLVLPLSSLSSKGALKPGSSMTRDDHIVKSVERFDPHVVVCDEAHLIRSPSSNMSKGMERIGNKSSRRIILSGTIMPHDPLNVYGSWRFMRPDAFIDASGKTRDWHRFKSRYAELGGFMGKEIVGYKNLDELREKMQPDSLPANKEDALDLPPTQDSPLEVHLSAGEQQAYADLMNKLATKLDDGSLVSVPNRLAQMMRLRQITSGYVPSDDGTVNDVGSSKIDYLHSLVHDTLEEEKRIVVFSQFRHEIDMEVEKLSEKGTTVYQITGSTAAAERKRIREQFGSTSDERIVLVAQTRTMSLAVNELVTASHAIFTSLSQQREDWEQARDRLNRMGQTRPVTFWILEAVTDTGGTVDQVILEAHRNRKDLEAGVMEHIRKGGNR